MAMTLLFTTILYEPKHLQLGVIEKKVDKSEIVTKLKIHFLSITFQYVHVVQGLIRKIRQYM